MTPVLGPSATSAATECHRVLEVGGVMGMEQCILLWETCMSAASSKYLLWFCASEKHLDEAVQQY